MSEITWYQQARLRAIETLSFWQGKINTRDIMEIFGVSRVIAQGDIHRYMEQASGNLIYHRSEKAYFVTSQFKNQVTSGGIDEWVALDPSLSEYVEKPQFSIRLEVARPLIQAINKRTGILIKYLSMKDPEGSERVLFPHIMVYTGFRWHVRAWCSTRNEFRDFNLARILLAVPSDSVTPPESSATKDVHWNQKIDIQLMANPVMNSAERSLIESEFNMVNKRLTVTSRAALVMYTLQAYQVDPANIDGNFKQRLVLANLDDIAHFLW
ncbi:MAG: WYL domain-containing protein [Methyloprofundus sp.]|nr:WYL domain-containing protein [Methyloprofundus sp.]